MQETLHFWTTGEWVTSFARQLFYEEHKEWSYIEELLLYCMAGTDTPEETLKQYGVDLLAGRRCLIGNTKDGTYALVEDKEHPELEQAYAHERKMRDQWGDNWPKAIREARERAEECRVRQQEVASEALVTSMLKMQKAERGGVCHYGWLNPSGKFYPVDFGDHQKWARDFLREEAGGKYRNMSDMARDYPGDVLAERGWVLLHNPAMGIPRVTNMKDLTKAQRIFLFDYYCKLGELSLADAVWEE